MNALSRASDRVERIDIPLFSFVDGFQLIRETLEIVLPAVGGDAHGDKVFRAASAADQRIAPILAEIRNEFAGGMGL